MEPEFSKHALDQMERRDITRELVLSIVGQPDSMIAQDEEIRIYSRLVAEKIKTLSLSGIYKLSEKPDVSNYSL